ncbi:hypothetical protein [Ureibacillus manganicus]|uniref:hypothetical protein n=1 Tax=Ureibacillus manganicus TaxID=1266064 RepID=UPI0005678DA6|nr:hypothetical protein [Ureibacillus manganicus]
MNQETQRENRQDHENMNYGGMHTEHHQINIAEELRVEWKINPSQTMQDRVKEITITIKDKQGNPATDFAYVHKKQMHLLAISKDLASFQHLHPDYREDGKFEVKAQFPQSGTYKLFADFMLEGGTQQLESFEVQIGNKETNAQIEPDQKLKKTVNGLDFQLKFDNLVANHHLNMTFTILETDSQEPITDLEPYLGSAGHVVIVSEDLEKFLHVHPINEASTGPIVSYMVSFPEPGIYKIWGQFMHKGTLFTVPFVINVSTDYSHS